MILLSLTRFSTPLKHLQQWWTGPPPVPLERPSLSELAAQESQLPQFVRDCPVAQKYLRLLGPLDWEHFPERPGGVWPGPTPHPRAPYVAAYLVKLQEGHTYMTHLRTYLVDHPALVWLLGFRLSPSESVSYGFDVERSVPSSKQLGRVLRDLSNDALRFLLKNTVHMIRSELPPELEFGETISLDTKHIQAWVAENNPKAYVKESDRLNKERQPRGDRDCKLGCKKKRNQSPEEADEKGDETPAKGHKEKNKRQTNFSPQDVYFWGYGSGCVATKIPGWAEVALAEMTQTFDCDDVTYFFPLMAQTEDHLGFRPPFGALDAAFDAIYVHDYFVEAGGLAAIPLPERGGHKARQFSPDGLPFCEAGLPMPLKSTFISRKTLVPQQKGRYRCPLLYPEATGEVCPIAHRRWDQGGCEATLGTSQGAQMRYTLDREGETFKTLYKQRSATERINSQATELGIERPKLRHQGAITNQNTLIYVLINLRALHRIRDQKTALAAAAA